MFSKHILLAKDCPKCEINDIKYKKVNTLTDCQFTSGDLSFNVAYDKPMPIYINEYMLYPRFGYHRCFVRCVSEEYGSDVYKWCGNKERCEERLDGSMQERQEHDNMMASYLQRHGHKCVTIQQTYPSQHCWCKQEPCYESGLVRTLRKAGHRCMISDYVGQVTWCNEYPCTDNEID